MVYELTDAQADEVLALTTRICEDNVRVHEIVKGARISEPTPDPEPEPAPTPDPEPTPIPGPQPPDPRPDFPEVALDSDPTHNRQRLQAAIDEHGGAVFSGIGAPIDDTIELGGSTLWAIEPNHGLVQVASGKVVLRADGRSDRGTELAVVEAGPTIDLPDAFEVGDWVYVQTGKQYDTIHKYDDGWLRQITAREGARCHLNKPIPRTVTDSVVAFRVRPSTPTIVGGIFEKAHPEDDYFDPIIEFLACTPTTHGIEVRSGGAVGVYQALVANQDHRDIYVHDLIDDDDAQGWRREADPGRWVSNPNGLRHYGYGVYHGQACYGGTVTGTITHCRHAVSTGDGSGKQKFFSGQNVKSGHPENIHHDLVVDSCWSSNISPHENGHDLTFTGQSIDPGRYANDHGSNDLQENPDHVNYRCDMTLRDFRCWLRDGTEGGRSNGISMGHNDMRTDGTQPTLTVDGVTIEGGRKGVDTRANLVIEGDGLTIRNTGSVGIHAQGEAHITGGPVTLEGDRATTVLTASTATVDIRE